MKIVAIIQSRMSSQRFPGKALALVQDKPLLAYLIERLKHAKRVSHFMVATSDQPSDDPFVAFCRDQDIPCFRGSLDDVAGRFVGALEKTQADAFVRVTGDSPFLDQQLVDQAIALFQSGDFDLVTNVQERTYPKGQSVEVLRSDTFRRSSSLMCHDEREHVTQYFYRHFEHYRIHNFSSGENLSAINLSVDTKEDFEKCSQIFQRMQRPHWQYTYQEILRISHELSSGAKNG